MQALLKERDALNKQIEIINDKLYAEHFLTRIDRAHEYIQESYINIADEYYLVAEDIATQLLRDFSSYYELDQRGEKYDNAIQTIQTIQMFVNAGSCYMCPPECIAGISYEIDDSDNYYYYAIGKDMTKSGFHRFNCVLAEGFIDEYANITQGANKKYLDALYLDNKTLSYNGYVRKLKSHLTDDDNDFSFGGQYIVLDISLVAIKYKHREVGSSTKAVSDN